ncbi:MAG: glutamate--tRNA ligase [Anaerolineales bacterium]|nr:glutamate--tRNA ligase [Anaerolineales bacterium]
MGSDPARVRFAPSPTGYLHLGGARTALYNFLFARQTSGQLLLRIEDTDRKRYRPAAKDQLMDSLRWLGIDWDEGPDVGGAFEPYIQSERAAQHREHAQQLLSAGKAYHCFCDRSRLQELRRGRQSYDRLCRELAPTAARQRVQSGQAHVIRFRSPKEGSTTVRDLLRGEITVRNAQLDDFVLLKSDGFPVYHLAAMADDHAMGITHVIRGEEWLPSLPKHALIMRAFGWPEPTWCHLSVLKKPGGKGKMSKRDARQLDKAEGHSIFIHKLHERGYLPEAVVNWMALMGWSLDDRREDFTLAELQCAFGLEQLNASPAAVDFSKLDHFQGKRVRQLSATDVAAGIKPYFLREGLKPDEATLLKIVPLIQERIVTFEDAPQWAGFFFQPHVSPEPAHLVAKKLTPAESLAALQQARQTLVTLPTFERDPVEKALRALADELGLKLGQLLTPVRVAVSGQRVSPPLFETLEILGRESALQRMENATKLLKDL